MQAHVPDVTPLCEAASVGSTNAAGSGDPKSGDAESGSVVPGGSESRDVVQVVTVVDGEGSAGELAAVAVESRLAACAQVEGPIRSTYRWEEVVHTDPEWRVVAKTTAAAADALVQMWAERHPYDVPEILVVPVLGGLPAYLEWVGDEVVRRG